jgi:hypothetical protein
MANNTESAFKTSSAGSRQTGALKRPVPAAAQANQSALCALAPARPAFASVGLAGLAEAALNTCTTVGSTTPAVRGVDGMDLNRLIAV